MENKLCYTCPYMVENNPYTCELSNKIINPELITECCWYPIEVEDE